MTVTQTRKGPLDPPPAPSISINDISLRWNRLSEGERRLLVTATLALDPMAGPVAARDMARSLTASDRALFGVIEAAVMGGQR